MTLRQFLMIASICALVLVAALWDALRQPAGPSGFLDIQKTNPLVEKPNMVDRLDFFDSPAMLDRATMQHVTLIATTQPNRPRAGAAEIVLSDYGPKSFPRSGTWTSDGMSTAMPFTELIPSWNAIVPADTGVFFHVKTRDARSGDWSAWLYIGQWGRTPLSDPGDRIVRFVRGVVNVDNLTL